MCLRRYCYIIIALAVIGVTLLYFLRPSVRQTETVILNRRLGDSVPWSEIVCVWNLLDLPEWPLQSTAVADGRFSKHLNALLMLYLGLVNKSTTLNEESTFPIPESGLHDENCTTKFHPHSLPAARPAADSAALKYVVEKVLSSSTLFCQVLRDIDPVNVDFYAMETHMTIESMNLTTDLVRHFNPASPDIPKLYASSEIGEAAHSKNKVVASVPHDSKLFQNSTLLVRFFFLVISVQPLNILTFQNHLIMLEKSNRLYLSRNICEIPSFEFEVSCNLRDVQKQAARWLAQFLCRANVLVSGGSFESPAIESYLTLSADFYFGSKLDDLHLLRIHKGFHSSSAKNANDDELSLLNYQLLHSAIEFLSVRNSYVESETGIIQDTYNPESGRDLHVIVSFNFQPHIQVVPSFQPIWTSYYLNVPYKSTCLSFKALFSAATAEATLLEDKTVPVGSGWHNVSIGVGWYRFRIRVSNVNSLIRPVVYSFHVLRDARESLSEPVKDGDRLVACQLEQDCALKFKANKTCGLTRASFDSWNAALNAWNKLPPCGPKNDASGVWMVPCRKTCHSPGSCYWSLARWQPFHCRYSSPSPSKLQECLADRQLIFVGDSTNRAVMESLVERLDAWLTPADRIKWHAYRYRTANRTRFHFDYYPKFWLPVGERPTLEQTLVQTMSRAKGNVAAVVVGGLDWMSAHHFDTIQRIVHASKVFIKTAGYGGQRRDEQSLTATTSRLHRLSQLARRDYNFVTVDTWNMTAARFRDFSPGKCECHFHEIVEWENVAGRYRSSGPINQAYTDILAHHLCPEFSN